MSRWFRFYDDAINDPKVLKLSDKLHRIWVGILCAASKNDGVLPSVGDLALMIRTTEPKMLAALKDLIQAGLIDDDGVSLSPHNWNARQFKSDVSTSRVKRFRQRERNVSSTVSETPPETETETETEKEKESCPVGKPTRTKASYSDEFEKFWQAYPRTPTMSKSEAWKVWQKIPPDDRASAAQAIEPYKLHLRSKPNLETVHACRFLSQRRFEGFGEAAPAKVFDIRGHLV